jgi:hypothetical protein
MSRRFRGHEQEDASGDLVLTLDESDCIKAQSTPDGEECVLAQGLLRSDPTIIEVRVGPTIAKVLRDVKVPVPSRTGRRRTVTKRVWERYYQEPETTDMIHTFDADPDAIKRAAKWIKGRQVTFKAPTGARVLGGRVGEAHGSNVRGTGQRRNVHHSPPFRHIARDN